MCCTSFYRILVERVIHAIIGGKDSIPEVNKKLSDARLKLQNTFFKSFQINFIFLLRNAL